MNKTFRVKKFWVETIKAELNQPFRTALGDHNYLENVFFTIELESGVKGQGEAAIATHITGETIPETRRILNKCGKDLIGSDVSEYLEISNWAHEACLKSKAAMAAIEMAVLDAFTCQLGIPLWRLFGKSPTQLHSDITIVIADLKETEESVKKYYAQGFRAFKVKIGRDMDLDLQRVVSVKRIAPRCAVYLDANQGYSADQTLKFLKLLKKRNVKIDLVEQPVPREDWEGLRRVTRLAGVPICADESCRSYQDAARIIRTNSAHVINIKLMKTGLIESWDIALLAKAHKIGLMMGGMMETSIAMNAAAQFAAGLGGFKYIDLDTPFFLKSGVRDNPYLNAQGIYSF